MNSSAENIALFDRFLTGDMDAAEKMAFEERLSHSESFKKEFDNYISFSKEIEDGAAYTHITTTLSEIHSGLYSKKKFFLLRPTFLIPFGIAASIALIILINPFGIADKSNLATSSYEPLANHSEASYSEGASDDYYALEEETNVNTENPTYINDTSRNELIDSLDQIKSLPEGTAFLMTANGYFFTSKHLVEGKEIVKLQQKQLQITFETKVVYIDSILDFAILKCSDNMEINFGRVPYRFVRHTPDLGDEVFTLGYSKKDIVYTKGVVSSETGFESDSIYFEVSLPSNAGHSGAPLFNMDGELLGIITAHHADKQAVTYILKHDNILDCVDLLADSLALTINPKYTKRIKPLSKRVKKYRTYIFEVFSN